MLQRNLIALNLFAMLLLSTSMLDAMSIQDARGVQVDIPTSPTRVITLAPHLTEWVFDLKQQARLVGTVSYSDFPPAAREIERVGDGISLDYERIILKRPDLILAWHMGTPTKAVSQLEHLGFEVYVSHVGRLQNFPAEFRRVAEILGVEHQAEPALVRFSAQIAALRATYGSRSKVKVFYLTWPKPIMTLNRAHIINDVIELCGGQNIFADLKSLTPVIDLEALLAYTPELILSTQTNLSAETFFTQVNWPQLSGQQLPQFKSIPPDYLSRTGLRMPEGIASVCEAIDQVRGASF